MSATSGKKLDIIEQPNNWAREMRRSVAATEKKQLPKIDKLLEWGVVSAGDIIIARGHGGEAELLENGHVKVNGEEIW